MGIDRYWMKQAYQLALKAYEQNEVPVGAVVVSQDNFLLGVGFNQVIQTTDPTAHAEMVALKQAARNVQNYRLLGATLYVTLEPCAMCAGALLHSRISRLVFATRDVRAGACGSVFNFLQSQQLNHHIQMDEGIMQMECAALLQKFFIPKR